MKLLKWLLRWPAKEIALRLRPWRVHIVSLDQSDLQHVANGQVVTQWTGKREVVQVRLAEEPNADCGMRNREGTEG